MACAPVSPCDLAEARVFLQEIGQNVRPVQLWRARGVVYAAMTQAPLTLGPVVTDVAPLMSALGLAEDDLVPSPAPRVGSTGASHLLVRVRDRAAVDRAAVDGPSLIKATSRVVKGGCYLYAFEEGKASAYARLFNPSVGLFEDAATGSAAGPLGAYLLHEGWLNAGDEFVVEQGTKMGRRSLLRIRFKPEPEISGSGVVTMEGRLHLP